MDQLDPNIKRNATRISMLERMLTIRKKPTEPPSDVRGPLGLNLLYASSEPLIDFIFVHGLGGGSKKTWTYEDDPQLYWPKEWLSKDPAFKNVRIHSFGYDSNWIETKGTTTSVHDFGLSLLNHIKTSPQMKGDQKNPIVAIGHSMGGVVIKEAFLLAHRDPNYQEVVDRFDTMVFLATPHRGADLAQSLNNLLRSSITHSPREYIANIERNSEALTMMNDAFRHVAKNIELWSFYETLKTNIGPRSTLIVKRDSAVLGYPGEHIGMIHANHRHVCKFKLPSDPNYLVVRDCFATIIDRITKKLSSRTTERSRTQMRQLESYLGVSEKPEDDLMDLQEARMKGSCEWVTEKQKFQKWLDPSLKQPQIYWITANPATGKSVLTAFIVEHLESLNFECSYYFFRHGDKVKSSLSGLLRSIAYQMALTSVDIRQRLITMMDCDIRFNNDDERIIWRKIFGLAIFRADFQNPHYWVIDALDECSNPAAFFRMITKVEDSVPVKILFTSRRSPEIVTHVQDLQKEAAANIIEDEISSSNTFTDIIIYLQSNMQKLPVSSAESRQELLQKILEKSSGCFLWVKLVLEELEGAWGQHQIETVLEEVPVDMDPLYKRALNVMAKKPMRTRELSKAILTWTMCATRPLTILELQSAIELEIGDKIEALTKAVSSLCGQLIYVDKHLKVQMIHQTARTFLLGKDLDSEFAIDPILGHLRLARISLQYLNGEEMRSPRARKTSRLSSNQSKRSPFVEYASESFSEHMRQTSSNNNELLGLLDCFLRTNVLSWIEHVAQTGNLHNLTTTAKIISNYLIRLAKYSSPLSPAIKRANLWSTDFIRLVANFGKRLLESPSSIYWLIPPFCPMESAIATQFGSAPGGIIVTGLSDTAWDDRLACIEYPSTQTTVVACGESYFAVGLQNGEIVLCYNTTCQEWHRLQHQEPIRLLTFDTSGSILASASRRGIKVWNVNTKDLMLHFLSEYDVLSVTFGEADNILIAATRGNGTSSWDIKSGHAIEELFWTDAFGDERFRRPPLMAGFSHDLSMLAIVYRGRPISLWDMEDQILLGFLGREVDLENLDIGSNTSVASLVFSSNPNLGLLAAAYEDGDLALFDAWNRTTIKVIEANAQMVACSPDGCTLVTGNSAGMVQLLDFVTLGLIYRINAFDYGVRSLVFSSDGLRFLDVRGQYCNVWEPSVLVRKLHNDGEEEVGDVVYTEPKTVGVADIDDVVEITTLVCDVSGDFLFCGKSDGTVCVYETRYGQQVSTLYSHAEDITITSLALGKKKDILVTADASSQLTARQLVHNQLTRTWGVSKTFLSERLSVSIDQLVLSVDDNHLLVSAESSRSIWDLVTATQIVMWAPLSEIPDYWINLPNDENKCLSIRTTNIAILDWSLTRESLAQASTIKLNLNVAPDEKIKSVLECLNGRRMAVEISRQHREDSTTKIFLFETSSIQKTIAGIHDKGINVSEEHPISPLPEFFSLSPHVSHIIGTYQNRLVFLNRDLWVCTVELEKRSSFTKGSMENFSIDGESRRPSISQQHYSTNSISSRQSRGREKTIERANDDRRISVSPLSTPRPAGAQGYRRSSTASFQHARAASTLSINSSPLMQIPHYFRHFFVPTSWHSSLFSSSGRNLTIRISPRGDVIFIKDEECAVVQRGLDFEEMVLLSEISPFEG